MMQENKNLLVITYYESFTRSLTFSYKQGHKGQHKQKELDV